MSATNRCRVLLLLSPLIAVVLGTLALLSAIEAAARAFGETLWDAVAGDVHEFYREVYRPARYGHVFDIPKGDR